MSILVIVDYQKDFCTGKLSVAGAENLKNEIQAIINNEYWEKIIYTFDTHTEEQYSKSFEKELFPQIHCEFGTPGWDLNDLKPRNLSSYIKHVYNMKCPDSFEIGDEIFIMKPTFNVWENIWSFNNKTFLDYVKPLKDRNIYICGVAGDYCVYDCVNGFVENGFPHITVLDKQIASIDREQFQKQKTQFKAKKVLYEGWDVKISYSIL